MNDHPAVRPPRAYRLIDRALLAGVAAGLGAHSQFQVWAIRAGFLIASAWKFSGAIAYAILWLLLPCRKNPTPIGLVAAERQGLRTVRRTRWPRVLGWIGALVVGIGISWVIKLYDTSLLGDYSYQICAVGWGIALVWLTRDTAWPRWGKALVIAVGIVVSWSYATLVEWDMLRSLVTDLAFDATLLLAVVVGAGATVLACLITALPWLIHPPRSAEDTQAELIAETRADMAAHLHDSVLQTLAVIQKQSGDARAVAQLARRQERELREWLYGERIDDESAKTALKEVVAELEATYPVPVELVMVGDHEMVVEIDALVRAAREAVLNAAKHSGADKIDVYAEIGSEQGEVFVRDRGRGFEMADIGSDRLGIRRSIIDRMARYGGRVDIRSTPGEGTEIHLLMPLGEKGNHG